MNSKRCYYHALIAILCSLLIACDDGVNFAPVTEVSTIDPIPSSGTHRIAKGETLYEIAWCYGLDYRSLATINHIHPPYTVKVGQVIYLRQRKREAPTPKHDKLVVKPVIQQAVPSESIHVNPVELSEKGKAPIKSNKLVSNREPAFIVTTWRWPAQGKVIRTFSAMNKGVNISGSIGDPVYASAPGKVVYCGDGLRGYGNLIIIKHNSIYLSAYAHNNVVFVKEGDWVKQGQVIAEIGKSGATKTMLHFEIRRAGKPIDPVPLLNA